jgi:hypothetical protein
MKAVRLNIKKFTSFYTSQIQFPTETQLIRAIIGQFPLIATFSEHAAEVSDTSR